MKFLIDAQLPQRLSHLLRDAGFDAIHTLDLPQGNRTSDLFINTLSTNEQRIIVTKDSDFVDSLLVHHLPWKLLLVSTGNIQNQELIELFRLNMNRLADGFQLFTFIELNGTNMIFHF